MAANGFGEAAVTLARNLELLERAPELMASETGTTSGSSGGGGGGSKRSGRTNATAQLPVRQTARKSSRGSGKSSGKHDDLLCRLALLELQTGNLHRTVQQEANAVDPWGGPLRVPSGSGGSPAAAKSRSRSRKHKSKGRSAQNAF